MFSLLKSAPSLSLTILVLAVVTLLAPPSQASAKTPVTGMTGAPGHNDCSQCHISTGNGGVSLTFSGNDKYEVGQLYSLEVTITDPAQTRFGFQMVARETANNLVSTGTWSTTDSITQVYGGEQHVGHKDLPFGMSSPQTFTVNWTAPAAGSGDVTFYLAAVAANGNGRNGAGDNTYLTSLTISELTTPPTPPSLSNPKILPDGSFQALLSGTPGIAYRVEFLDTNFDWQLLEEITLESESRLVEDPDAPDFPTRLYRVQPQAP